MPWCPILPSSSAEDTREMEPLRVPRGVQVLQEQPWDHLQDKLHARSWETGAILPPAPPEAGSGSGHGPSVQFPALLEG